MDCQTPEPVLSMNNLLAFYSHCTDEKIEARGGTQYLLKITQLGSGKVLACTLDCGEGRRDGGRKENGELTPP